MSESNQTGSDLAVFSRGSLQMSFDLIRKKDPQLALQIRNIAAGTPLEKTDGQADNKHSDYFRVEFDSFQVRAVVETLVKEMQSFGSQPKDAGVMILAKSLTEDWMALAKKMIDEYEHPSG